MEFTSTKIINEKIVNLVDKYYELIKKVEPGDDGTTYSMATEDFTLRMSIYKFFGIFPMYYGVLELKKIDSEIYVVNGSSVFEKMEKLHNPKIPPLSKELLVQTELDRILSI